MMSAHASSSRQAPAPPALPPTTSAAIPHGPAPDDDGVAVALRVRRLRRALRAARRAFPGVVVLTLAATALTVFVGKPVVAVMCRDNQSDVYGHLKQLYVAQEAYRFENGSYAADAYSTGFFVRGDPETTRYRYALVNVVPGRLDQDKGAFRGFAVAAPRGLVKKASVWTIDQNATLQHRVDGCKAWQ
jgi:hypothetical protein